MDHHVYFWLKEEFRGAAARAEFEAALAGLFGIGLVAGGRWATPAAVAPRPVLDQSWDYALTMRFNSLADHDAYQQDPVHLRFMADFKATWSKVLVMDLA